MPSEGRVAPHAGAWIETRHRPSPLPQPPSLPMRERGLKPAKDGHRERSKVSLPMRERGLKLPEPETPEQAKQSLPMRERGLKPDKGCNDFCHF